MNAIKLGVMLQSFLAFLWEVFDSFKTDKGLDRKVIKRNWGREGKVLF